MIILQLIAASDVDIAKTVIINRHDQITLSTLKILRQESDLSLNSAVTYQPGLEAGEKQKTQLNVLEIDQVSFSRSAFPFDLKCNFYVCGRFSIPSFYHFWSRSPRIPQQAQSVFEGAHFL